MDSYETGSGFSGMDRVQDTISKLGTDSNLTNLSFIRKCCADLEKIFGVKVNLQNLENFLDSIEGKSYKIGMLRIFKATLYDIGVMPGHPKNLEPNDTESVLPICSHFQNSEAEERLKKLCADFINKYEKGAKLIKYSSDKLVDVFRCLCGSSKLEQKCQIAVLNTIINRTKDLCSSDDKSLNCVMEDECEQHEISDAKESILTEDLPVPNKNQSHLENQKSDLTPDEDSSKVEAVIEYINNVAYLFNTSSSFMPQKQSFLCDLEKGFLSNRIDADGSLMVSPESHSSWSNDNDSE